MTRRGNLGALAGLGVGVCVALLVFMLFQIANVLTTVKHQQAGQRQLLGVVASCTTPKGACYKQGEKAQRASVDSINEVTVYTEVCANTTHTVKAMERCVLGYLHHEQPQPHIDRGLKAYHPAPKVAKPSPKGRSGAEPVRPRRNTTVRRHHPAAVRHVTPPPPVHHAAPKPPKHKAPTHHPKPKPHSGKAPTPPVVTVLKGKCLVGVTGVCILNNPLK